MLLIMIGCQRAADTAEFYVKTEHGYSSVKGVERFLFSGVSEVSTGTEQKCKIEVHNKRTGERSVYEEKVSLPSGEFTVKYLLQEPVIREFVIEMKTAKD